MNKVLTEELREALEREANKLRDATPEQRKEIWNHLKSLATNDTSNQPETCNGCAILKALYDKAWELYCEQWKKKQPLGTNTKNWIVNYECDKCGSGKIAEYKFTVNITETSNNKNGEQ